MKQKLLIFGTGKISESISYFFNRDGNYEIVAYLLDDEYITDDIFLDKPVIPVSNCEKEFSPNDFYAFVAVGYQGMNSLRTEKVDLLKKKGYKLASYISPYVLGNFITGENTIIMDHAMVQPCAKFGNNVFVWGGAMIGHHAEIQDNCWITGGALIGGITVIKQNTFVGLGAIIGHEIIVGEKCMIGAGSIACTQVKDGTVLIEPNTAAHRLNSDQFTRMSTCFRV